MPFALCHEPGQAVPGHYALAGHVHLAVQPVGPAFERIRLPCFGLDEHSGLLLDFGAPRWSPTSPGGGCLRWATAWYGAVR
ncbi:hypothetical protein [Chitiniphilus eburneus]|uniref:Calcineurin-like phosphoesterase domain-containing protein n=1 Tax=Chitiniphilus eburneus TaxID=2571148 RepID=A0A4U0PWR0_9NEIS|nr:hypothetical protein [Chitiniphilus eburneus]TJZ72981.1 hypothetical protein FAZ21_12240 [Chitiniphilus eburneus]